MAPREYRTFDPVEEDYYRNHLDEIDSYLEICFEEYANDGCTPALLASLRMVARVKGVSAVADTAGLSRKGLQKALSTQGNPRFKRVNVILHALGYRLAVQKL